MGAGMARPNYQDEVAQWVRRAIFSGELKPGERINQDELAEKLELSRLPVREAMIALEREGLIRTVPRRGSFVWDFSKQDILDQYEVYAIVSGLATERAAANLSQEEIAELRRSVDEMTQDKDPANKKRRTTTSTPSSTGPARLPDSCGCSGSWPAASRSGSTTPAGRSRRGTTSRSSSISSAGDAKAAAKAMRDHIRHTGQHAVRFLPLADEDEGHDPADEPAV